MSSYPADREADVVLRDGSTIHLRPVRPEDRPALLEMSTRLTIGGRSLAGSAKGRRRRPGMDRIFPDIGQQRG